MSVWHFDLFAEEKPVLFASTPPIVCVPTLYFSKFNQAGHNNNLWALLLYIHWQHHLAPCFSTLLIAEVYLGSQFSLDRITAPTSYPEILKEMSLQLGKEEDASRSSFRSGETWHDKRGKHRTVVTFTSTSESFSHRAPCTAFASSTWIISRDGHFKYTDQQRLAHPLLMLHRFWALDTESGETLESWHAARPKLPTSLLDKLHCCLRGCSAQSRSDRRGGEGAKTSRRDNCQVQIWILRLRCNGR